MSDDVRYYCYASKNQDGFFGVKTATLRFKVSSPKGRTERWFRSPDDDRKTAWYATKDEVALTNIEALQDLQLRVVRSSQMRHASFASIFGVKPTKEELPNEEEVVYIVTIASELIARLKADPAKCVT